MTDELSPTLLERVTLWKGFLGYCRRTEFAQFYAFEPQLFEERTKRKDGLFYSSVVATGVIAGLAYYF